MTNYTMNDTSGEELLRNSATVNGLTITKGNGDVVFANTMPQAEYMYGCGPTATAMLLGYYDLYG
ncbi:MAG: hypothetical protein IJJ26_08270 [Victivallales bacterium]|nr:hypothetical protein [Victivallales bacterium]